MTCTQTAETVLIAVGANRGDRHGTILAALDLLARHSRILRISSFQESVPVEGVQGGTFLNGAVALQTGVRPDRFLSALQHIEKVLGRPPDHPKYDARTIDLDIILWGRRIWNSSGLKIPHPRFRQRLFVLEPLHEIAPDAIDPITGKTIADLYAEVCHACDPYH